MKGTELFTKFDIQLHVKLKINEIVQRINNKKYSFFPFNQMECN